MEVRRSGNFGFVDPGNGSLYSFDISGRGKGWEPSSIMLNHNRNTCFTRKMSVAGYDIVPMGDNNDMPGEVMRLLDRFYAARVFLARLPVCNGGTVPGSMRMQLMIRTTVSTKNGCLHLILSRTCLPGIIGFVCTVVWLISPTCRASLSSLSATVRPVLAGGGSY